MEWERIYQRIKATSLHDTVQDLVGGGVSFKHTCHVPSSHQEYIMSMQFPFLLPQLSFFLDCDLPMINPVPPLPPTSLDPRVLEGTCLLHLHNLKIVCTQNEILVHEWKKSNNQTNVF